MKSNDNLRDSIDAAAVEHAERARAVAARASMVRRGEISIESFAHTMREAIREYLARNPAGGMTPQQFFAKHEMEKRAFFRELKAKGHKSYRANQQDHEQIVNSIFQSVHEGTKPAVQSLLKAHAAERRYDPEWAKRVAEQTHGRRMGRTLVAKKDHPVLKDLKEGHMLSQTHKAALQSATYSGLACLLFSGSQIVRGQRRLQQRMEALEAELAAVKAEATRANARLDSKDAGKDWKETARAIRAAEPAIANRELARRVGMSESTVRKYLAAL